MKPTLDNSGSNQPDNSNKPVRYTHCGDCNCWVHVAAWGRLTDAEKKAFGRQAAKDNLLISEMTLDQWRNSELDICKKHA